jgi:gliding motility-associated-like protein
MENQELPECTNLTSPLNLDIDVPVNTNLSWDAALGAEGYRLTVGTSTGLGDIFNDDVGNVTTFDLQSDLPENTEVFVFIQPYNDDGNAEFCEEESFITGMPPTDLPLCTTLSSPEDGSIDIVLNTEISWRAVGDIEGYILNLGTSPGANDVLNVDVGLTTSYELTENLPSGQEIFVTILPYNESVQAENCESQSFTTVEEIEEVESLFGFSPDGDGNNDFWTINGIEEYPNNSVMIFNRWGDMVFKIDNYDNNSNVFRGEANQLRGMGAGQLPEGTYFFQIKIPSEHNLKTSQGYLVLKR